MKKKRKFYRGEKMSSIKILDNKIWHCIKCHFKEGYIVSIDKLLESLDNDYNFFSDPEITHTNSLDLTAYDYKIVEKRITHIVTERKDELEKMIAVSTQELITAQNNRDKHCYTCEKDWIKKLSSKDGFKKYKVCREHFSKFNREIQLYDKKMLAEMNNSQNEVKKMSLQLYTRNIDNEYHKIHWSRIRMTGLVKLLTNEQLKELKEILTEAKQ